MRLGWFALAFALALPACSSDDSAPVDAGPNACVRSGGICAVNFPFMCAPGYEAVASTDPRATACGKSEGDSPRDVPCCIVEATPPDTGTKDTSTSDTASEAGSDASVEDAPSDATTDATTDGSAG